MEDENERKIRRKGLNKKEMWEMNQWKKEKKKKVMKERKEK